MQSEGLPEYSGEMLGSSIQGIQAEYSVGSENVKLLFLTHVDERAPAAGRREERGKSVWALRRIDP